MKIKSKAPVLILEVRHSIKASFLTKRRLKLSRIDALSPDFHPQMELKAEISIEKWIELK